jgi:hypothetical protein
MEKEAQRPMNILQLTLKETDDDKESSIEECVKKTFYNKETLDNENEYWCECNEEEPVNAICESKLEKLPDILFLQLNRFKYDNSDKNKNEDKNKKIRINSKVSFDRNLDLELKDGTKESYELRAVVNHLGNHYTTFRRDGDVWYELNDSFFSVFARSDDEFKKRLDEIDPKSCLSYKQEAYIFLYEKKKKQ